MKQRINETTADYRIRQNAYMAAYRKTHAPYKLSEEQKERARKVRAEYCRTHKEELSRKRKAYYMAHQKEDLLRSKNYQVANTSSLRERELKRKYGIDLAAYQALYKKQSGACAICKSQIPGRNLDVDHCHSTGKVRGLLCRNCNILVGHAKNDPTILILAADYLS